MIKLIKTLKEMVTANIILNHKILLLKQKYPYKKSKEEMRKEVLEALN